MELSEENLGILETHSPIDSYKNYYKQRHQENVSNFFDELVTKSQINIDANRATSTKIVENDKLTTDNNKSIRKQKSLKVFAIILVILSILSIIIIGLINFGVIQFELDATISICVIVLDIIFIVLFTGLIKSSKLRLKEFHSAGATLLNISQQLHTEAEEQMASLNKLLYKNYNNELFSKTLPLVNFDKNFDTKRLHYLQEKFGFNAAAHNENVEQSTLFVQSGEIKGNPFFFRENLQHTMGTRTYQGFLTIHWTTTERDSNGSYRTVSHSETLRAELSKPCPYYSTSLHLVYANEAGNLLSFSRHPSNVHQMNERKVNKFINKRSEELQELTEESTAEGSNFTALGNNEFDSLFYAKDRDHETQFRLLFTPLAQKEFIKILRDAEVGFGDDFTFIKRKMINYIYPEHMTNANINVPENYFIGIDYDAVKKKFNDYHNNYFKHIYFTFSPIFAIPLYMQHQTQEYIYQDLYVGYVSFYQHEMTVNSMDINMFRPEASDTNNIIKTSLIHSQNKIDTLNVYTWGYKTVERMEYVPVYGRDRNWHQVPVTWTEYLVVEKNSRVDVMQANDFDEQNDDNRWIQKGNILARVIE